MRRGVNSKSKAVAVDHVVVGSSHLDLLLENTTDSEAPWLFCFPGEGQFSLAPTALEAQDPSEPFSEWHWARE